MCIVKLHKELIYDLSFFSVCIRKTRMCCWWTCFDYVPHLRFLPKRGRSARHCLRDIHGTLCVCLKKFSYCRNIYIFFRGYADDGSRTEHCVQREVHKEKYFTTFELYFFLLSQQFNSSLSRLRLVRSYTPTVIKFSCSFSAEHKKSLVVYLLERVPSCFYSFSQDTFQFLFYWFFFVLIAFFSLSLSPVIYLLCHNNFQHQQRCHEERK